MMFTIRFDMRAPTWAGPAADAKRVGPYRIFTPDEAVDYVRGGRLLPLHPLCGVPPDVAWPYLEQAAAATALDRD